MKIGVIVPLHSYKEEFKKLREFGISVCQFNAWDSSATLTEELALDIKSYVKSLQSECLVSGRIHYESGFGDFGCFGYA